MSQHCVCGKGTYACTGAKGCPYNETVHERKIEIIVPDPAAAAWNVNNKEREASTYAGNTVSILGEIIKDLSQGGNYDHIEICLQNAEYQFNKLKAILRGRPL